MSVYDKPPRFKQPTNDLPRYVVVRDFGHLGQEGITSPEMGFKEIANGIMTGELNQVLAVVEFNVAEGWSCDRTGDIKDYIEEMEG
jgi:hypothetical protein